MLIGKPMETWDREASNIFIITPVIKKRGGAF
jgi:hypothetical protein